MHVITRKRLNQFTAKYPETKTALAQWYKLMKQYDFNSIAELREIFPSADKVGKLTVFNIGGIDILPHLSHFATRGVLKMGDSNTSRCWFSASSCAKSEHRDRYSPSHPVHRHFLLPSARRH